MAAMMCADKLPPTPFDPVPCGVQRSDSFIPFPISMSSIKTLPPFFLRYYFLAFTFFIVWCCVQGLMCGVVFKD